MTPDDGEDKGALRWARDAALLLDEPLRRGAYGDVEGVDVLAAGLRALASALAAHFAFPESAHDGAPTLDEVLAYLTSKGLAPLEAVHRATQLQKALQRASYHGLSKDEIQEADVARSELFDHVQSLLDPAERSRSHG